MLCPSQRICTSFKPTTFEQLPLSTTKTTATTTDAFPWGAWPRDAAVTRTGKQAGKALRSQGHHYACFRILATLKQGNESMYSNTSGYVHMGFRLDWDKVTTGQ